MPSEGLWTRSGAERVGEREKSVRTLRFGAESLERQRWALSESLERQRWALSEVKKTAAGVR